MDCIFCRTRRCPPQPMFITTPSNATRRQHGYNPNTCIRKAKSQPWRTASTTDIKHRSRIRITCNKEAQNLASVSLDSFTQWVQGPVDRIGNVLDDGKNWVLAITGSGSSETGNRSRKQRRSDGQTRDWMSQLKDHLEDLKSRVTGPEDNKIKSSQSRSRSSSSAERKDQMRKQKEREAREKEKAKTREKPRQEVSKVRETQRTQQIRKEHVGILNRHKRTATGPADFKTQIQTRIQSTIQNYPKETAISATASLVMISALFFLNRKRSLESTRASLLLTRSPKSGSSFVTAMDKAACSAELLKELQGLMNVPTRRVSLSKFLSAINTEAFAALSTEKIRCTLQQATYEVSEQGDSKANNKFYAQIILGASEVLLVPKGASALAESIEKQVHALLNFSLAEESLVDDFIRDLVVAEFQEQRLVPSPSESRIVLHEWLPKDKELVKRLKMVKANASLFSRLSSERLATLAGAELNRVVKLGVQSMIGFVRSSRMSLAFIEAKTTVSMILKWQDTLLSPDIRHGDMPKMGDSIKMATKQSQERFYLGVQRISTDLSKYIRGTGREIGIESRALFELVVQRQLSEFIYNPVDCNPNNDSAYTISVLEMVLGLPEKVAEAILLKVFEEEMWKEIETGYFSRLVDTNIMKRLAIVMLLEDSKMFSVSTKLYERYLNKSFGGMEEERSSMMSKSQLEMLRDVLAMNMEMEQNLVQDRYMTELKLKYLAVISNPTGISSTKAIDLVNMATEKYQIALSVAADTFCSLVLLEMNTLMERAVSSMDRNDFQGSAYTINDMLKLLSEKASPFFSAIESISNANMSTATISVEDYMDRLALDRRRFPPSVTEKLVRIYAQYCSIRGVLPSKYDIERLSVLFGL